MGKTVSIKTTDEFIDFTKAAIIDRESQEKWMEASQNGKIGELRTKLEILKKKFWVLEREIDANGADLIVQKASLVNDLIDISGAPVAFVQVKNIGPNTAVEIDSRYIYYVDGEELKTKDEFFLFIYRNDNHKFLVFLPSKEIDGLVKSGTCSKFIDTTTKVPYVKFTSKQIEKLNKSSTKAEFEKTISQAIETIDHALSIEEYNRSIGLRHFLGVRPSKLGVEAQVQKYFTGLQDDDLVDTYFELLLFLYKQMELGSIRSFVIKDFLTNLSSDPRELSERVAQMQQDIENHTNIILKKWDKNYAYIPDTYDQLSQMLSDFEKALDKTTELHQDSTKNI
ncbi:hypothetical protein [Neobacillus mesonae]|uniref:hypothetical protein n=1 Tax=Neobacillus mesonae TaxID=1193713 RepID=UPI00257432FF|nr:hypothetical protein [Neobacillus mesonae]